MQTEPFEQWRWDATRASGEDSQPGTVLAWRDRAGSAAHVAVTLG
jgi:cell wall-associated NlpC family hydrolase